VAPKDIVALQRSERHSILPAYTLEGVLYFEVYTGTTDASKFVSFIENLIPHCNAFPLPRSVLVTDNASIHHDDEVETLLSEAGIKLVYLPPYSPDFNPIEEFFAQLKAYIKRDFHLWQDGMIEKFEEYLSYCVRITGSDVEAARGHFRDYYIDN
jgi:transposase